MADVAYFATSEEAEAAFYEAFEHADIEAMMSVWAADTPVACIHPGGTRLEGIAAIKQSWEEIFAAEQRLTFRLTDNHYTQGSLLSIHQLRENIEVNGVLQGVVLATNIYQFINGSWRITLHHASPDPQVSGQVPTEQQTLH